MVQVSLADGTVLRTALAVLHSERFAFVGIVEEWDASICLLHHTLGGGSRSTNCNLSKPKSAR